MKIFYKNGRIITDGKIIDGKGILVEDGKIIAVTDRVPEDAREIDLGGNYISSGFVDIHCHGGGGAEFVDCTDEAIFTVSRFHAEHGTRVLYPTISASDFELTYRSLEAIEKSMNSAPLKIAGVHLEGPYLSPEMIGAQKGSALRVPLREEYEALYDRFGGLIKRWGYAPELDVDGAFLKFLTEHGIVPSTAHSAAEYSHMKAALDGGNRLVTHLYSCTSTVTRHGGFRRLGVIESAFLEDDIYVETIADGCHLPYELLKMIYKIKGDDRICLVTDAIRFAGAESGEFIGEVPYVIEDGVAKLKDRSAFAGSIASADRLIKTAVTAGIELPSAVKMLTETPATVMELSGMGRIAEGYDAIFTVFDENINVLEL